MITILYLCASAEVGGAEESLLGLLGGLDRQAYRPILACPAGGALADRAARQEVPVFELPLRRLRRTSWPPALLRLRGQLSQTRRQTDELARRLGADLVHANSLTAALQAGGAVPLIAHLRDARLSWLAARALSSSLAALIAPSRTQAENARRYFSIPIRHLPNGVDAEVFSPAKACPAHGHPYLLMNAHLTPWKSHDLFIECLARLRARDAAWRGVIAGTDLFAENRAYQDHLRRLANDLGLEHALTWAGAVPPAEMPALVASAAALVHPAAAEPFGRSLLEAMASETPIVAVDSPGAHELLADGGGVLTPAGEVPALAAAVERYLASPQLAAAHGRAGRESILKNYRLSAHVAGVSALYRELLQKP